MEKEIKRLKESQLLVNPASMKKHNARNKKLAATQEEVRSYIAEGFGMGSEELIKVEKNIRIPYVID